MKLSITTSDLPDETWLAFAVFHGYPPQVMTTTESPNYLINNPQTVKEFLAEKFLAPIQSGVESFLVATKKRELSEQQAIIDAQLAQAAVAAKQHARELVFLEQI